MSEQLRRSIVGEEASIVDAMRSLEASMSQVVLVVDANERLVGILTDGDIRRAILAGDSLEAPVATRANRDFFAVGGDAERADVLELMQARRISQVPAVDDDQRVVGLHLLNEMVSAIERPNWAVILAGGRGTRLGGLTTNVPKPMLPVAGRPILERIVLHLVGIGVRRIFLSVNYLADQIEEHFKDGHSFGCTIEYLHESEPLGTGGPLSLLPNGESGPQAPFLVMNGDLVTQANLGRVIDFHERGRHDVTMGVREYVEQVPFGCVEVDGDVLTGFVEKPSTSRLVNAGIYVVSPACLGVMSHPAEELTMPDVIARVRARGGVARVFEIEEDWIDVGRREQFDEARRGA